MREKTLGEVTIAGREYVETPTDRIVGRKRVMSGTCLRRKFGKVRGKANVKRAKRERQRARKLAA